MEQARQAIRERFGIDVATGRQMGIREGAVGRNIALGLLAKADPGSGAVATQLTWDMYERAKAALAPAEKKAFEETLMHHGYWDDGIFVIQADRRPASGYLGQVESGKKAGAF